MDDTTQPPTDATRPQVCPGCGAPSRSRAAFCLRCGTRLPDATSIFLPIGRRAATSLPTAVPHEHAPATAAIVEMDPEGRITSINAQAAQLLAVREDDACGRPYTTVFGSSMANRMLHLFLQATRSADKDSTQVISTRRADGTALTLRATISTQHDSQGNLLGFMFIAEEQAAPGL